MKRNTKSRILILFALVLAFVMAGCPTEPEVNLPAGTHATVTVGGIITPYPTFLEAFGNLPDTAATLTLIEDGTLTEGITLASGKSLTLDLNGKTLEFTFSGEENTTGIIVAHGASLTIGDSGSNGQIKAVNTNGSVYAIVSMGVVDIETGTVVAEGSTQGVPLHIVADRTYAQAQPYEAKATLRGGTLTSNDTDVATPYSYGVFVQGKTAKFIMESGSITGVDVGISGNGTYSETNNKNYAHTVIRISGGSVEANDTGIYLPQYGETTITGGSITAQAGIEMRSGKLTVSGGTITGTGAYDPAADPVSGQTSPNGSGLAIVNIGYPGNVLGDMDVVISGNAVITSTQGYGISERTQGNAVAKIDLDHLNITGGTFSGDAGAFITSGLNLVKDAVSITGGTFSSDVDPDYLAAGYTTQENADGSWTVVTTP